MEKNTLTVSRAQNSVNVQLSPQTILIARVLRCEKVLKLHAARMKAFSNTMLRFSVHLFPAHFSTSKHALKKRGVPNDKTASPLSPSLCDRDAHMKGKALFT